MDTARTVKIYHVLSPYGGGLVALRRHQGKLESFRAFATRIGLTWDDNAGDFIPNSNNNFTPGQWDFATATRLAEEIDGTVIPAGTTTAYTWSIK